MAENRRIAWMQLTRVMGIGPILIRRLLDRFGHPETVLSAPMAELLKVAGIGPQLAERLHRPSVSVVELAAELEKLKKINAQVITWEDREYPQQLSTMADPPPILYVHGDGQCLRHERMLAMVGTRNATRQGLWLARKLARELASAGVTVVSGMALGIDGAAHLGALEGGGATVAVLATGLDILYPMRHHALRQKIVQQGCVVTESALTTQPSPRLFPVRNRIISGLCQGVLVVEASLDSGSMITARLALEQGKEVLAVPGRAGEIGAAGVNHLLRQGAVLVEKVADILEAMNWPKKDEPPAKEKILPNNWKDITLHLLDYLSETPSTADELLRFSQLSVSQLASILLNLELAGLIERGDGDLYRKLS